MKKFLLLLLIPIVLCGATFYSWRYREHATDCTALTDGRTRDLCFEIDDEKFYKCVPDVAGGVCDTAGEWDLINAGNADTVTNATLSTALTVDTGTVGLKGNVANTSVLTLGAGASSLSGASSGTNSGDNAANSSSTYIGTTAVALNRASAALTLAGITLTTPDLGTPTTLVGTNISGTAASLTAGAVSTIAGLAPNTATTQASQPNITALGTITSLVATSADINGGTLDGVQIGGTTATGELFVNNASDDADGLGLQGTSGQVLTSAGAGANPTWAAAGGAEFFVGTFTRGMAAASGNVAYTGVGFQPTAIQFIAYKNATKIRSDGFDDGTNSYNRYWHHTTNFYSDSTESIHFHLDDTHKTVGHIASFDADGFTITWTKTNDVGGTGTVFYMAFK